MNYSIKNCTNISSGIYYQEHSSFLSSFTLLFIAHRISTQAFATTSINVIRVLRCTPVHKDWPVIGLFSLLLLSFFSISSAIDELKQSGKLDMLKERWWTERGMCLDSRKSLYRNDHEHRVSHPCAVY